MSNDHTTPDSLTLAILPPVPLEAGGEHGGGGGGLGLERGEGPGEGGALGLERSEGARGGGGLSLERGEGPGGCGGLGGEVVTLAVGSTSCAKALRRANWLSFSTRETSAAQGRPRSSSSSAARSSSHCCAWASG
jgi:hypothetical protein